jgi:hypothetical protein
MLPLSVMRRESMISIKSIVGEPGSKCFNGYALLCQKFGG